MGEIEGNFWILIEEKKGIFLTGWRNGISLYIREEKNKWEVIFTIWIVYQNERVSAEFLSYFSGKNDPGFGLFCCLHNQVWFI